MPEPIKRTTYHIVTSIVVAECPRCDHENEITIGEPPLFVEELFICSQCHEPFYMDEEE